MSEKYDGPPKTIAQRSGQLLKLAGKLATQEIHRRVQSKINSTPQLARIAQAQTLVKELGNLKGAAMKLGQMLALEARDYLPEEVCKVLDKLHSEVSFLGLAEIEAILRSELGGAFDDLRELSPEPIGAASIGQVHTARLPGGEQVAIKVQYPGIRDSIQSDVKSLGAVLKAFSVVLGKKVDLQEIIQEFSEIFVQESDYLKEAEFTEHYRQLASGNPQLVVPKVFKKYSSNQVLTLSYEPGLPLVKWLERENPSEELRKYYARCFLDLYTLEFCEWGLVQTDPNLGNFLIRPEDRKLVLLDFGACKYYSPEFRIQYSRLIMAVVRNKPQEMIQISEEMKLIDSRESREAKDVFKKLLFESMSPITAAEYDFRDNQYPEKMRDISRELVAALKFSPPPKDLIFLHRKLSGVFYVLRALKVRMSLNSYLESFEKLADLPRT